MHVSNTALAREVRWMKKSEKESKSKALSGLRQEDRQIALTA